MNGEAAIWITGIGAVSPLGSNFQEIAEQLFSGATAIARVRGFDVSDHPCQIASQLDPLPCPAEFEEAAYDKLLPLVQCAVSCTLAALKDADVWRQRDRRRIGLVLGLGSEWMSHWDTHAQRGSSLVLEADPHRQGTAQTVSQMLELSGPTITVGAACASGNHALAQACAWLRLGWVDGCLAGGCDMGVTPYSLASFGNLRALSRRNDAPATSVRPFDRDRDGMVLGEGGVLFYLERAEIARRRAREPYGQVAGIGLTSDAHHLVVPNPNSTQAINAMQQALAAAGLNCDDIDYINAHATGTPLGDANEAGMIRTLLGPHYKRVPVSSTKSMTGHLLGAAAAIEALACLAAIQFKQIPPTINLEHPDPKCELLHVANTSQQRQVRVALSNSFGFGGHNSALILTAIA